MFELTNLSVILFITTAINLFATFISWQRRKTKGGMYFAWGMLSLTFWTLASGLDYAAIAIPWKVFFAKLEIVGYNSALALFALFVLSYAGFDDWINNRLVRALLILIPISNILLAWTNDWHRWLWTGFENSNFGDNVVIFEHGPAFIWVAVTGYLMMLIIILNLWQATRKGSELSRRQAGLLFWSSLIPTVSNVIYLLNIPEIRGVDLTSITFSITGMFFLTALYGTRLLDLVPIARHVMIESMPDCILVLDEHNHLVDFNPAAQRNFGIHQNQLGLPIDMVMAGWPKVVELSEAGTEHASQATITLEDSSKVFDARLTSLTDNRGQLYGKLIVLSDVSRRFRTEQALERQLLEIQDLHRNLQETHTQLVDQQRTLARLEERERLSRDLHDGVGQALGHISARAELAQDSLREEDIPGTSRSLSKIAEAARQANRDIRDYILELQDGSRSAEHQDFFDALRGFCQNIKQAYHFDITLDLPAPLPDVVANAEVETQLTYIIHEALQNARKHSGASEASVTIRIENDVVQAVIADRGKGLGGIYSGPERRRGRHFGMGIMRSRAEEVGGSLHIDTAPAKGTRITVSVPRRLGGEGLTRLRVLLADDHPLFVDGMQNMLSRRGAQIVGVAVDGIEAQQMARALKPDLILMDIQMPRMDGLEATRAIKTEMPDVKIVMLTTSADETSLFEALSAGASGYLLKGMSPDEFMTLLGEISIGESSFSSDIAAKMLEIFARPELQTSEATPQDPLAVLTSRQRDVLSLVAQGMTYKEVGQKLFLTERTVKFHMGEILKRLQLKGRRELIEFARKTKVEPPDSSQ